MKPSLARFCLLLFLILEIAISTALYFLYQAAPNQGWATLPTQQNISPILAAPITGLANHLRDIAIRIARHPQTIQALKSGDEQARQAQLDNIHMLYPEADIEWAPPTGNMTDKSFTPPLSVLYSVGEEHSLPVLRIAQPVIDTTSKAILGFVIIRQEGAELRSLFNALQLQNTYAELQQTNNGSPYNILLQRGDARLKANAFQTLTDLPGTAWRLVVWHTPPVFVSPLKTLLNPYFLVWAFISACLLSGLLAFYFSLRKVLAHDTNTLVTFFSDIRRSRLQKAYNVWLIDLEPNFRLIFQLGRLMLKKHKQVADSASLDHLSQVNNRRSLEEKLSELHKTLTEGWTHSLLIIDIDNFKHVNDTFGHDAGDALIIQIGKLLKEHLRSSDFIARLGGDEFCVIFPNTPLKRGAELAERLRNNLPAEIELTPGVTHRLLWSGGLSEFKKGDASENMILSRADTALLDAKRTGRNRTKLTA